MRLKLLLLLVLLLSACAPYKMDIRQGNLVTPEMREKLKVGMTRAQVRMLLGTPLVEDPFHANRWDYVYYLEHDKVVLDNQRLTLYFDGENVKRIDDSRMPPLPAAPASEKSGAKP